MIAVAAIVAGRADLDRSTAATSTSGRTRRRVLQAAADWTSVLINMNKDTVEASMQKLHDGTVGQLNADFDSAVEPYRQLVQTLQSRTTGQIDSVAIESIHHTPPGQRRRRRRPSRSPSCRRSPRAPTP